MKTLKREPIGIREGIPIFSEVDPYIENYSKIASNHLSLSNGGKGNPWISKRKWNEMEDSTIYLVKRYSESMIVDRNGLKILDVGVGLGRLLNKIRNTVPNIREFHGMDIAMPYLRVSKSKGFDVVLSKIEDIPYSEGYFDMVTCTDVLEHVIDLNLCVSKILSVIRPGGYLIVRVPNREDLGPYMAPDYPYFLAHLRTFDLNSIKILFVKAFGLEFVESSPGLLVGNPSLFKCRLPFTAIHKLISGALKVVLYISKKKYQELLSLLYYPTEINVVFKKPLKSVFI